MSYEPSFWFPVKRYGWGWGLPVRWQGWVVLFAYLALMVTASYYFRPQHDMVRFWASVGLLTGVFIVIVAAKGERPVGWRGGNK